MTRLKFVDPTTISENTADIRKAMFVEEKIDWPTPLKLVASHRQATGLFLRFFRGLTYEEIGQVLRITHQGARSLVRRGLRNLRKHMRT